MRGDGKPYANKANRKLAKHVAKQAGVKVNDILNLVRFQLAGHGWYYLDPPDAAYARCRRHRYHPKARPTERRRTQDWVRECLRLYEVGATSDVVTAREISILANSDRMPLAQRQSGATCLPEHQKTNLQDNHAVTTTVLKPYTGDVIPKKRDIRSCLLAETTPYLARGRSTFDLHDQVCERPNHRRAMWRRGQYVWAANMWC